MELIKYDSDSFCYICLEEESRIGSVQVNFNYIAKIEVVADYRRAGYGSLLLQKAEARIRSSGYTECILDAESEEVAYTALVAFYQKNGYINTYGRRFVKSL